MAQLRKAILIKTQEQIQVYRSQKRGTWIDYSDCKTEYQEHELDFINR